MERKFSISEAIILLGRISLIEGDINNLISQCAGSEYESVNAVWDILPHKECVAVTSHTTQISLSTAVIWPKPCWGSSARQLTLMSRKQPERPKKYLSG